jgi:hypothetical protein
MSKSEICRVLNMDIRILNKLVKIDKNHLDENFMSVLKKKQKERLFKKQELIAHVRELKNNYYSISKISRELNLDPRTIKKYLNNDTIGISGNLGVKRKSILAAFIEKINSLINLGATSIPLVVRSLSGSK